MDGPENVVGLGGDCDKLPIVMPLRRAYLRTDYPSVGLIVSSGDGNLISDKQVANCGAVAHTGKMIRFRPICGGV
jgi:hypothetical protein